jgi:hypothetical protein
MLYAYIIKMIDQLAVPKYAKSSPEDTYTGYGREK